MKRVDIFIVFSNKIKYTCFYTISFAVSLTVFPGKGIVNLIGFQIFSSLDKVQMYSL